ncbi:hypothetical protein JM18_000282 [Phytophthora kernoviae]|uniref:Uncharacterized protein n=1 Tax=Phytophthora kernoviae TaxID=325452 RepID=A0A921VGI3_9STRA|nr:hypothetical protein JM18_000282 [Phytophthora kernoviae]
MGRRKLEIWELFKTVVPKSGTKPHPDVESAFYSAGLPPHAIENPNFRGLFNYEVPTRQELVNLLRTDRVRDMVEGTKRTGTK